MSTQIVPIRFETRPGHFHFGRITGIPSIAAVAVTRFGIANIHSKVIWHLIIRHFKERFAMPIHWIKADPDDSPAD